MSPDESQIRDLVATWMAASKAGDTATVLALMTEDVIFMTPGRPPFGKAEFAAGAAAHKELKIEGHADVLEVEIFGACAFARNHLDITLTVPGQPPQRMAGHTLGIYRKEADGRWRLARDANFVMSVAD